MVLGYFAYGAGLWLPFFIIVGFKTQLVFDQTICRFKL
jgi:hypothetical protein